MISTRQYRSILRMRLRFARDVRRDPQLYAQAIEGVRSMWKGR